MDYGKILNPSETPQGEPIPDTAQVPNSAGGFSWAVDDWGRLDRFLVLGAEGGTYYIGERKLVLENAAATLRCLAADGPRAVERIAAVSESGRAPKQSPAIFALTLAVTHGDAGTKAAALAALPRVCRIGTHLMEFVRNLEALRVAGPQDGRSAVGRWGRSVRRAVAGWYAQPVERLAYQVTKYGTRVGWSHRDVLRMAHPTPASSAHAVLFRYVVRDSADGLDLAALPYLEAIERLGRCPSAKEAAAVVREHRLPREAVEGVNTEWLREPAIWEALLPHMPTTAMIRNLGRMTALGVLAPLSQAATHVVAALGDAERLRKARVHPITVLAALRTYAQGHGERGGLTWTPVGQVVDALDAAFYATFPNAPVTGKRLMLGLDVSSSMGGGTIAGVPGVTPALGAAAMALVTAATEPAWEIMAFANRFRPLDITPRMRLDGVLRRTTVVNFGGTDCAVPMLYALEAKRQVDAFLVYTDSETWVGQIHPAQALRKYREQTGITAKLIVVAMTSNGFTIADPADAGMLDVVGFDAAAPQVIADFVGA